VYIPASRERVEIVGRAGNFFVQAVDREENFATVIPLADAGLYVEDVLFAHLRPHRPDVAMETEGATPSARTERHPVRAFF